MLSNVKLRIFKRAVILKMKAGEDLDDIINAYNALSMEEKKQLKDAVLADLQK